MATTDTEPNFTWFARAVTVASFGMFGTLVIIGWNVYAREVSRIDRIETRQATIEERQARIEAKVDAINDNVKEIKQLLQKRGQL